MSLFGLYFHRFMLYSSMKVATRRFSAILNTSEQRYLLLTTLILFSVPSDVAIGRLHCNCFIVPWYLTRIHTQNGPWNVSTVNPVYNGQARSPRKMAVRSSCKFWAKASMIFFYPKLKIKSS